jgi:hypothetical protein
MAKKPTQDIVNYDEELAKLAGTSAVLTDSGGGGKFFSTRAGVLQYDDVPLPGNQMIVIVAAWCLENVYYEEAFDPDNRTPPTCFAFCKDPELKNEMGPNPEHMADPAFSPQSPTCHDCPQNQWGSAAKGRGKACGNRRRLACLPAGTYTPQGRGGGFEVELFNDPDHFATCEAVYLKVPVMSGKGFDAYVREVADQLRKPLFAVYTRIYLTPDPKSQFKINFELMDEVDSELIPTLMARYRKAYDSIDFPYVPFTEDEDEQPRARAAANKKLTGGRGKR